VGNIAADQVSDMKENKKVVAAVEKRVNIIRRKTSTKRGDNFCAYPVEN